MPLNHGFSRITPSALATTGRAVVSLARRRHHRDGAPADGRKRPDRGFGGRGNLAHRPPCRGCRGPIRARSRRPGRDRLHDGARACRCGHDPLVPGLGAPSRCWRSASASSSRAPSGRAWWRARSLGACSSSGRAPSPTWRRPRAAPGACRSRWSPRSPRRPPDLLNPLDLAPIVEAQQPDLIVLADEHSSRRRSSACWTSRDRRFRVVGLTSFYEYAFGCVPVSKMTSLWFMSLLHVRQRAPGRPSKRVFDVVVAVARACSCWRCCSRSSPSRSSARRGPSIYRQARVGERGRRFTMYKLRTMAPAAEAGTGAVFAQASDPRCTRDRARSCARRTSTSCRSCGTCSRARCRSSARVPSARSTSRCSRHDVPYWSRRLMLKPGLTGWAQVRCGYAADCASAAEKLSTTSGTCATATWRSTWPCACRRSGSRSRRSIPRQLWLRLVGPRQGARAAVAAVAGCVAACAPRSASVSSGDERGRPARCPRRPRSPGRRFGIRPTAHRYRRAARRDPRVRRSCGLRAALRRSRRATAIVLAAGQLRRSEPPFEPLRAPDLRGAPRPGRASRGPEPGRQRGGSGALVRGLVVDVADANASTGDAAIAVWGSAGHARVLDTTVRGHGVLASGVMARRPEGLVIRRVVARGFTSYGVLRRFEPARPGRHAPARGARGRGHRTGGAPRAALRERPRRGVPLDREHRAGAAGADQVCAWSGLWTGTASIGSTFDQIDVDGTKTGVYIEHFTHNSTFRRLRIGRNVEIGLNAEWDDPSWGGRPASVDNVIEPAASPAASSG